ncbi:hypothetical protein D3C71_934020 [compost metagenome]
MHLERLADQVPGVQARIQRRVRILEDHLDMTPHLPHLVGRHVRHVLPGQADSPFGRLNQLHQQAAGGGLSGTGLAHQCQRFTGAQGERHALDRVHIGHHLAKGARLDGKALGQAGDFQHGGPVPHHGLVRRTIAQLGHGRQQILGITLPGRLEQRDGRVLLDLVAMPHDHDAVSDLGDDAHVVRDEEHRHADFALQVSDQVDDLGLHRHVQRGGRLVGDQQLRPAGKRHRDHHALAHAAGQIAWVLRHAARRLGHLHRFQHGLRLGPGGFARDVLVQQVDLGKLVADRHDRVKRGHGLLEDHGYLVATDPPQRRLLQFEEIHFLALARHEPGRARRDAPARALDEAQDGQGRHRLARAGLSHQRDGLAAADGEVQRLDGAIGLAARAEFHAQALDRKQSLVHEDLPYARLGKTRGDMASMPRPA